MRTADLASAIVRYALDQPFRQSWPIGTRDFSKYLRDRGLHLGTNVLTDLAIAGVLLPIAVDDAALAVTQQDRYRPVLVGRDRTTFADVGRPVLPEDVQLRTTVRDPIPDMLWHPFQLWYVSSVVRIIETPSISAIQWLYSRESFERLIAHRYDLVDPTADLARFAESDQAQEFYRVLAVLLAAEPLVAGATVGTIRISKFPREETFDDYYEWRDRFDPNALLRETGATVDLLRKWHRELADWAGLRDPVGSWREVLRYAPRDKRLQFRGDALLAEDGYYAAESLRRYLAAFHGVNDLPDEDQIGLGPQVPAVKERLYGSRTTTDGDRSVKRNVLRAYHLDPAPRMRWFVEGDTEVGFIERYAELAHVDLERAGVELINMKGVGALDGDRIRAFLDISKTEEVFAYITADSDKKPADRREVLRQYADEGLIPAGFHLFAPDFEAEDFQMSELTEAAHALAGCRHSVEAAMAEASPATDRKRGFAHVRAALRDAGAQVFRRGGGGARRLPRLQSPISLAKTEPSSARSVVQSRQIRATTGSRLPTIE